MKKTSLYITLAAAGTLLLTVTSCNDFLDRNPTAQTDPSTMFTSEASAEAAVNGMYRTMLSSFSYGQSTIVVPEFSANHLSHSGGYPEYENFATHGIWDGGSFRQPVPPMNNWLANMWQATYTTINSANNIIQGVSEMSEQIIDDDPRNRFVGEAKFVRALNYFFLVRAFGNIPLETEPTSEQDNPVAPQASPEEVYELIIQDLTEAVDLLAGHTDAALKGRASQWTAKALLAKVYLYHATLFSNDFTQAADLAEEVVNGPFSLVPNFINIWEAENSSESIFELQFDEQAANAFANVIGDVDGNLFYARGTTPSVPYSLYAEEDIRRDLTIKQGTREDFLNRQYIAKFPHTSPATQNIPLIRMAEILLIHAEAKARVDNAVSTESHASLFEVQDRAGVGQPLSDYSNLEDYIVAIQEEKEKELMFEGETWFDFCRTGLALEKYSTLTDENYFLYPIPAAQRQRDPSLQQNPGY